MCRGSLVDIASLYWAIVDLRNMRINVAELRSYSIILGNIAAQGQSNINWTRVNRSDKGFLYLSNTR